MLLREARRVTEHRSTSRRGQKPAAEWRRDQNAVSQDNSHGLRGTLLFLDVCKHRVCVFTPARRKVPRLPTVEIHGRGNGLGRDARKNRKHLVLKKKQNKK